MERYLFQRIEKNDIESVGSTHIYRMTTHKLVIGKRDDKLIEYPISETVYNQFRNMLADGINPVFSLAWSDTYGALKSHMGLVVEKRRTQHTDRVLLGMLRCDNNERLNRWER